MGVLREALPDRLGRNHQDARRQQRTRRFQVEPIEEDGGENETLPGAEYPDCRLAITVGREHLDAAIDDDMQEVRPLPLAHQLHVRREALQESPAHQGLDVAGGDVPKQPKPPHLLNIVAAHEPTSRMSSIA